MPNRADKKCRELIKLIAINVCVLVVLLFALEGMLAGAYPVDRLWESKDFVPGWRWRDSPDRAQARLLQLGIRGPQFWSADESNQLGFRGRRIKYSSGDYVVLLVGDSQVESAASRFEQMPEAILEDMLRRRTGRQVRVFSIGASGWGQDQQLLALREYFDKFRADLIALWHTPSNDYWENSFPDRSRLSTSSAYGAGPLKPVFLLEPDQSIRLFDESRFAKQPLFAQALHRFNVGRIILKLLSAAGLIELGHLKPNNLVLRAWLRVMPPAGGHQPVEKGQCPAEIVQQWMFSAYNSKYVGRAVTVETDNAVDESRGHFTPFLDPLNARDEYAKEITHALLREIKEVANNNLAQFLVFAPDLLIEGKSFNANVVCVKKDERFYRFNSDLFQPIRSWAEELHFQKLDIEMSNGLEALAVDPYDAIHLNFLGNKLVMQALAERIASGVPGVMIGTGKSFGLTTTAQ